MNINFLILNILGISLWCVISFLLLFCLITNLMYILKNKKELKHLFKIHKEHKLRDISQIVVHSFIISLFIILNLSCYIDIKTPKKLPHQSYHDKMKIVSTLYQATILDYKLENKTNIGSIEDFMNSIIRRTTSVKLYSYYYDGIQTQNFSKFEIEKKNLSELENKPTVFFTNYNSMFTVIKFKSGCAFYDDENVLNSDCVILIDGNGVKPPNVHNNDRAYLYIKGDEVPAKIVPEKSLRG